MTLLIIHFVLLAWISRAMAQKLVSGWLDRMLTGAMLFWGNIVLTSLALSLLEKLGEPNWFFRTSLLFGLLLLWLARRLPAAPPVLAATLAKPSRLLLCFVFGSLGLMLLANLRMASANPPNNYDSLAYHLPRVMYYLGQNSLAHFETADIRQVYFPFNYNLLQLFCFIYGPPWVTINFINVFSWVIAGGAVYRLARLCGCSTGGSLVGMWLALTATGVLAQATATTLDLTTAAALLSALVFALRWRQSAAPADAVLGGLAAGLAAGAKLTVVFFGPAVVVLLLTFWYQHRREQQARAFSGGVRAWSVPAMLAIVLSVPFILYNLSATGHWMTNLLDFTLNKPFSLAGAWQTGKAYLFQLCCEPFGRFSYDLEFVARLNGWFERTFFSGWNKAFAYSDFYVIPPDLNEDHVWYGFAGPLFLACAVLCLWRDRRLRGPLAWLALLGLGWFATYFAMNKWSLYIQRYFLPALTLLAPCAAAVWDGGGSRILHGIKRAVFFLVMATALWFSVIYLNENRNRPFWLPSTEYTPPVILPDVPPMLRDRLAEQPRVNVITDGTNERAFLLMNLGHNQRFTSNQPVDPARYNIFSFWGFTRNNIYSNIAHIASHAVVAVPDKKTAGVEFLGTIGKGVNAFDYAGLMPHANETKASPANANIVVLVRYGAGEPERFRHCSLRVNGLNPRDDARVEINAEMEDGTTVPLMAQDHSGEVKFGLSKPFKRLAIQVFDRATGRKIGYGDLPYTIKPSEVETEPAFNATTLFRSELISMKPVRNLSINGLADLEGPYVRWDLPLFRWARQPTVRIEIPANPRLRRLRLTFDARLQVRDEGRLSVLHNGRLVQDFLLRGRTEWQHAVLEFAADAGENVIELRDAPDNETPDWLGYLEQNPDVKDAVVASGQPLEAGAREHYEKHGAAEHRRLPMKSNPREVPDWLGYLEQNPDVKAFVVGRSQPLEEGARAHYEAYGRNEHRTLPRKPAPAAITPPESEYFVYRHLQVEGLSNQ